MLFCCEFQPAGPGLKTPTDHKASEEHDTEIIVAPELAPRILHESAYRLLCLHLTCACAAVSVHGEVKTSEQRLQGGAVPLEHQETRSLQVGRPATSRGKATITTGSRVCRLARTSAQFIEFAECSSGALQVAVREGTTPRETGGQSATSHVVSTKRASGVA